MTVLFVVLLVWSYRTFRLSNISYTTIFIFMCLHVVGAHYTYSEVPYQEWTNSSSADGSASRMQAIGCSARDATTTTGWCTSRSAC